MTPAIKNLKKAKIKYQVHKYDHGPSSSAYGEEAAEKTSDKRIRETNGAG